MITHTHYSAIIYDTYCVYKVVCLIDEQLEGLLK